MVPDAEAVLRRAVLAGDQASWSALIARSVIKVWCRSWRQRSRWSEPRDRARNLAAAHREPARRASELVLPGLAIVQAGFRRPCAARAPPAMSGRRMKARRPSPPPLPCRRAGAAGDQIIQRAALLQLQAPVHLLGTGAPRFEFVYAHPELTYDELVEPVATVRSASNRSYAQVRLGVTRLRSAELCEYASSLRSSWLCM